jgi:glyoxylase-like metal-dependent hydrolase (beta-lactamase superfamily II)
LIRFQDIAPLFFLAACSSATIGATTHPVEVGNVIVTRIADGAYAAIRKEPLGLAVNANSLFIVGNEGVAVVDAQFTREATLENIAALRAITSKPVRFVINTHCRGSNGRRCGRWTI